MKVHLVQSITMTRRATRHRAGWAALLVAAALGLAGCGGGDNPAGVKADEASAASPSAPQVVAQSPVPYGPPAAVDTKAALLPPGLVLPAWIPPGLLPPALLPRSPAPASPTSTTVIGPVDPGLLLLLIPDSPAPAATDVSAWTDAASEVGVRMQPITDSQFLALGTTGALQYAGLVLPDSLHQVATDAIVTAVHDYTQAGGKTFLTYDFGALAVRSDGALVFPIPKSRFSDMAGVDYVLYDKYLGNVAGLGPVTGMRSTLRELLVPPGKSEPYPPVVATSLQTGGTTTKALQVSGHGIPLLAAAGVSGNDALYVPVSTSDPGGVRAFDPQQLQKAPGARMRDVAKTGLLGKPQPPTVTINFGSVYRAPAPTASSQTTPNTSTTRLVQVGDNESSGATDESKALIVTKAEVGPDDLEAYSGYLLGPLIYYSYVTEGTYTGTTLTTSPQFGLVAGVKSFGAGQVMFVNTPLTYLKGRTDSLPMHGYLNYFVQHVLDAPQLSGVPNGVPGMTFNWHLDAMEAQAPMLHLEQQGIFKNGPFSIHMTAGPDDVSIGDGLGFNLLNNPTAQQFLQRMVALGHSVGSHGGWDHDYYGTNATEDNEAQFLQYLILNRNAVDSVIGQPSRDYSAPQGNNPVWAMQWLESQGVVAAYYAGDTGLGITRQYRNGTLLTPNLWVVPVTPFGNYATFEEFQDFNIPKQDVINWYRALVDFDIAHNTMRMVYGHPPGADEWLDVTKNLMAYVKSKGSSKFKWYTMARLADFMTARSKVTWAETPLAGNVHQFTASHPSSLAEMVWMLPKDRYARPTKLVGAAVSSGGAYWLVKASAVTSASFQAKVLKP